MKTICTSLLLTVLTAWSVNSIAQIVGTNAFIQGDYVEVGINDHGTYIADEAAPAGYHDAGGFTGFGMVADQGKDGWDVGSPMFCGDYFEPGSPEEGFAIKWDGASYYNTFYVEDIDGSVLSYNATPVGANVVWRGSVPAAGLQVTQVTTVPIDRSTVLTTVKIKNTGDLPVLNVYYSRNADPDNDFESGATFVTENIVVQNHPVDPWALVSATGTSAGCYLAMASKQTNSIASYGAFSTAGMDPAAAYNGISPYSTSGSTTGDMAIQMSFRIPTILAGETKVINFIYGTNQSDLEDLVMFTTDEVARGMEESINGYASFQPDFRVSPNPSSGLLNLLAYGFDEFASLQLAVMDLTGRMVFQTNLSNDQGRALYSNELPSDMVNGTYLAVLYVNGVPYTEPFVLQR
ncbi:MAG TPA: T9SS type A sorting domain-containing protein [Chitinophagales bacterium]|nr:T9SS type A sorting domain-containing protein [Chitinophagales bacterium]HAE34728.1 hypothetical protein [Bacteroidota bacterium]HPE98097.1 T9SS type A sorting domain-containing protein [Chitinophagales bacterium]